MKAVGMLTAFIKFGFVELFDEKMYITPHPSPAAFAGRHLPPKGKASDTATLKII